MAKIRPSMNSKRGSTRYVKTKLIIHRTAGRGKTAFEACVRVGSGLPVGDRGLAKREGSINSECGYGKNPRRAIAAAFKKYASYLTNHRRGAFAGMKRKR